MSHLKSHNASILLTYPMFSYRILLVKNGFSDLNVEKKITNFTNIKSL